MQNHTTHCSKVDHFQLHMSKCSLKTFINTNPPMHKPNKAGRHAFPNTPGFTWPSSWFHHLDPALREPGQTHQRPLQIPAANFTSSPLEIVWKRRRSTLIATAPCRLTAPSMPGLTVVGACELGQDAERAGLGGTGAWLPVLSVLDQPLLAMVIGDKARQVLHPEAVPAHTPKSSTRQARVNTAPPRGVARADPIPASLN